MASYLKRGVGRLGVDQIAKRDWMLLKGVGASARATERDDSGQMPKLMLELVGLLTKGHSDRLLVARRRHVGKVA